MSSISRAVHVIPIGVFKISAPQVLTHHMIYMAEIVGVLVGSLMVLFLMLCIHRVSQKKTGVEFRLKVPIGEIPGVNYLLRNILETSSDAVARLPANERGSPPGEHGGRLGMPARTQ